MRRRLSAYNARLQRFDRELRLRWSNRRGRILLERRAFYERISINPALYGYAEHDTVRQLRDGYFELGSYTPQELPPVDRLIAYLKTQDTRRRGTQDLTKLAHAMADELDADYARREALLAARATAEVGERAAELWETNRWREGARVAVPREGMLQRPPCR